MKALRLTLYEILGYLIPGMMAMLAAILAMWGSFWHTIDTDLVNSFSRREIVLLLLFAYLLGHIMQAIGNLIENAPAKIVGFVTGGKEAPDSRASQILSWFLCVEGQDDYNGAM